MEHIPLEALLPADFDPTTCKLHCAVFNRELHPIDVLANDPAEWQGWNSWRSNNNDFNRQFVFSLAQDRHDPTLWLFGGIWEILNRRPEPHARSYDIAPRDDLMGPLGDDRNTGETRHRSPIPVPCSDGNLGKQWDRR